MPTDNQNSTQQTAGIVVAAAGAGIAALGGAFGLVVRSKDNAVETAAGNREEFNPADESSGQLFETLQWVGLAVGAAAMATGVILYLTAPSHREAAHPRASLAPLALPGSGSGGAVLQVTF